MSRQQRSSGDDLKIALEPASRYSRSAAAKLCSTAVSDAMPTAARSSNESERPATAALQAACTSLYQYFRADRFIASDAGQQFLTTIGPFLDGAAQLEHVDEV